MLTVKRENPTFTAVVKKEGRDGIKVTVDKDIMAFSGEKSLFIADQESICRCDPDYTECLTVFMEYMVMGSLMRRMKSPSMTGHAALL